MDSLDKKGKSADDKKLLYYETSIFLKSLKKEKMDESQEFKMLFSEDKNIVTMPEFYKRAANKYKIERFIEEYLYDHLKDEFKEDLSKIVEFI